ncbi:hypothetical protein MMC22_008934 [Lobaria immixta]|nr:hypothetical protein [Lobaria immixta]
MEESISRNPQPNEFVTPHNVVYAMTDMETWEMIEFLMTLEPVKFESLDPDDRVCGICQLEFTVPVKTVCGHVFCEECIIAWLDPLEDTRPSIFGLDIYHYEESNIWCPLCRKELYSKRLFRIPMEGLAANLWFWDSAYALAGVARSEKEEYSRILLWKYINHCRSHYRFELVDEAKIILLRSAQIDFLSFTQKLKTQSLTPVQEELRKSLEGLGKDLTKIVCNGAKGSYLSDDFDPEDLIEEDTQSDNTQSFNTQSDNNQSFTTQSDTTQSDSTQSFSTQSDDTQTDST